MIDYLEADPRSKLASSSSDLLGAMPMRKTEEVGRATIYDIGLTPDNAKREGK